MDDDEPPTAPHDVLPLHVDDVPTPHMRTQQSVLDATKRHPAMSEDRLESLLVGEIQRGFERHKTDVTQSIDDLSAEFRRSTDDVRRQTARLAVLLRELWTHVHAEHADGRSPPADLTEIELHHAALSSGRAEDDLLSKHLAKRAADVEQAVIDLRSDIGSFRREVVRVYAITLVGLAVVAIVIAIMVR